MKKDAEQWLEKIQQLKGKTVDLSLDEDLSIGIMNLISLEEHFYFTAMKTNNQKYLDMMQAIRELRVKLLKKIVTNPVGEEWCISKHLLAASMRLVEVGTKEMSKGNKKPAEELFESAFDLYSMFFAINLKIVGTQKIEHTLEFEKQKGVMTKFSKTIKEIVNCCKEW
ncbi:MAG: hypothetical protein J4432_03100 [DPANN group archaeon]|nr:hypothetical protein [DPANN group archaeon]